MIDDHFEMFLACANVPRPEIEKLLESVDNQELSAIGIYIEDGGYRIAEVEFEIDWDEHQRMVGVCGAQFDIDLPGWENGISPEAYVSARRLTKAAKAMGKPVCSWIRVSPDVRKNPTKHKAVCDKLGYSFGSTVPPWKDNPKEKFRTVDDLPEAKVIRRSV